MLFSALRYADELAALDQVRRNREAADRAVSSMTEDDAYRVARIGDLYPWLPAGVAYSIGRFFPNAFDEGVMRIAERVAQMIGDDPAGMAEPGTQVSARDVAANLPAVLG